MSNKKQFPFYIFLLAMYPTIALFANNLTEVSISIIFRPIFLSLIIFSAVFLMVRLIIKDWQRAGCVAALVSIFFFSYGHLYNFIRKIYPSVARHRYLAILFMIMLGVCIWLIIKYLKKPNTVTFIFNIVSIFLLIYPLYQIVTYYVRSSNQVASIPVVFEIDSADLSEPLPDVYYIVLDAYMREDALLRDMDFDNSEFINGLEDLGFYVADCAMSNYGYTLGSITSALNMEYLDNLNVANEDDIWVLLKQSKTRGQLESIGYKTVSFETGYDWSRLGDADILVRYKGTPIYLQTIYPFELMLLKTTALLVPLDLNQKLIFSEETISNPELQHHIDNVMIQINELPNIPEVNGSKFVFVHVLVPHVPYIFDPQGNIQTDPGFYSGPEWTGINDQYKRQGYTESVQFINNQMLDIFRLILERSETPPIIIVQGDHGLESDNRYLILNAYYFPDKDYSDLYRSITPVNSFRIVFNNYFGTDYAILKDQTYANDSLAPVNEAVPFCIQEN